MPSVSPRLSLWLSYGCLALSMFMLGSSIAIGKLVVTGVPVFLFSTLCCFIAILILLPGMLHPGFRRGLNGTAWKGLALQSFFGCFLSTVLMLYGVLYTTAVSAGIITCTLPSVIALLAWIGLRERISLTGVVAIIFAMGGVALINLQDAVVSAGGSLWGNLLVLGGVLSEALFAVFSRRFSLTVHPWSMAFGVNLIGLLLFLPFSIPQLVSFNWSAPDIRLWGWMIFYAITTGVFSFLFWFIGVSRVPANVAGLFTAVMPVSSSIIGILLLNERLSLGQAVGMFMALFSIFLGAKKSFTAAQPVAINSP